MISLLIALKQQAPPTSDDIQAGGGFLFVGESAPVTTRLLKRLQLRQIVQLNVFVLRKTTWPRITHLCFSIDSAMTVCVDENKAHNKASPTLNDAKTNGAQAAAFFF